MNSRGMTLIELLVGLAVASLVAAIVLTALSTMGNAVAKKLTAVRMEDSAWLALAAIARDLHRSPEWRGCLQTDGCGMNPHLAPNAVIAGEVRWFADNGLWRCERNDDCDKYLDGVPTVRFVVDVAVGDEHEIRREDFSGNEAKVLEVILWTRNGSRYARTVGRPVSAQ